jgi:epoxyqueuosine reductase
MTTAEHAARMLGQQVIDACLAMGFALAGIAPVRATSRRPEFLEFLESGRHGDMTYLAELLDERLDIAAMLPGARAVIVVADQYARRGDVDAPADSSTSTGLIARYARGRDYHKVIKRRLHMLVQRLRELHPGAEFRSFVDTGPVLEREHAHRAGLGGVFIGKHTLAIHPKLGSWFLLGGIATTLDIRSPEDVEPSPDHCGSCTRCIDACPTQAITAFQVDARRCISYLTLEHQGEIAPEFHQVMGDRVIGCDVCQEVCPYNTPLRVGGRNEAVVDRVHPAYTTAESRAGVPGKRIPLVQILSWTEADRSAALSASAAKRASLEMLQRNATIAAENAIRGNALDAAALRAALDALAHEPRPSGSGPVEAP